MFRFRKDEMNHLVHEMNIVDHLKDQSEPERIKQITGLTIDMPNIGCTCWCKSFMIFTSDTQIDCANSKVLKAFSGISSIDKFLALGLPIANCSILDLNSNANKNVVTKPNGKKCMEIKSNQTVLFELDLLHIKSGIQRRLGLSRLDCYPILWCQQQQIQAKWTHSFAQRIACNFIAVKLLDRHTPTSPEFSNIDMFPLKFEGFSLDMPERNALSDLQK